MRAKFVGFSVLVLHVVVLAGFSLMQGCTTGDCPISWLNWPYSKPHQEPVVFPAVDDTIMPVEVAPVTPAPMISSSPYVGPSSSADHVYSVQKGDTLSYIASMYGTTWKKLAEYNSLSNPNRLVVGQEIRIPGSLTPVEPVKRPSAPSKPKASSSISQGTSYVIQKGDTLGAIAKRSGLTVTELKVANSLTSDRIIAGKSLTIPKKGSVRAIPKAAANPAPVAVAAASAYSVPAPAPIAESAPAASVSAVEPVAAPVATASTAPVYEHVLYPGETLEDVARQYGSSQAEIMKINNITDPASIKPGTKLLVPIPE
jgi:LysM repeat protein